MSESEPPLPTSHRAPVEPVPLARRLVAPLAAVAVVIIVIVLLIVINGHNPKSPSTAASLTTATPAVSTSPGTPSPASKPKPHKTHHPKITSTPPLKPTPRSHPTHRATVAPVAPPPNTAMADVTVLNNSRISGLAHQVAAEVGERGWRIAQVGNLPGRVPSTTVYYAPGDEAAAAHLAAEFGQISRIEPASEGRIPLPGIILVVTRYWVQ